MIKPRITSVFAQAAMILLLTMTAQTAWATTYRVNLSFGSGSGPLLFKTIDDGEITKTKANAENMDFYKDGGKVGYRLDHDYCPEDFHAPLGKIFTGWGVQGENYHELTSTETTFTAHWGEWKYQDCYNKYYYYLESENDVRDGIK